VRDTSSSPTAQRLHEVAAEKEPVFDCCAGSVSSGDEEVFMANARRFAEITGVEVTVNSGGRKSASSGRGQRAPA
jgi:hypothetical protein